MATRMRVALPIRKQMPMKHSIVATTTIATSGGTRPRKSTLVVSVARSSAGLTPGKYFNSPNSRKIAPTEMRSAEML